MPGNANFSTLIATTLQNFSNKIVDNIINNNATLFMMRKSENIKVVGGGRQFIEQLLHTANSSFGARGKLATIPTPVTDGVTASEWDIKVISGSIVLPTLDVAMNSGSREQLINYTRAKVKEAQTSMENVLGAQMYTASPGADDFNSIPEIVAEDPTTGTVGGIDSSTDTYWRNYSYDTVVSAFNTSQAGFDAIDTSLNEATFGRMGPKLMTTTKAIYTLVQLGLTANQRYTGSEELGNAGFKALSYAGIPIVFDDNVPTGNLYGLDTESLKLKVLSQGNFKQTLFQVSTDQLAESALMYLFGNLTCDSRRTNFVIDSITG